MPKTEPQSYEIAPYSDPELDTATAFKVINQIFTEYLFAREALKNAVWVKWAGDKLKVHYHSYEMFLPQRLDRVQDESRQILDAVAKELKSEFKSRTGRALKLAEDKDLANYTVEKVSLNERFYFKCWRFYDVSWS